MATKRMFSREITDSDAFLDLSLPAQALYFHVGMVADDEGMISSAKRTGRSIGASDDALNELVQAGFLIAFPTSGVYAIRHFFVNNAIRADRAKETIHKAEAAQLQKQNGIYTIRTHDDSQTIADCPADVRQMSADCSADVNQDEKQQQANGGIDQSDYVYQLKIDQIKAQLAADGWTMTDIDKALDRCRGKEITDPLSYLRRTLENMKKEKPIVFPSRAQDFPQRDYSGVDQEIIDNIAQQIAAMKAAEGEAAAG